MILREEYGFSPIDISGVTAPLSPMTSTLLRSGGDQSRIIDFLPVVAGRSRNVRGIPALDFFARAVADI